MKDQNFCSFVQLIIDFENIRTQAKFLFAPRPSFNLFLLVIITEHYVIQNNIHIYLLCFLIRIPHFLFANAVILSIKTLLG